jgi:hypothetical protein
MTDQRTALARGWHDDPEHPDRLRYWDGQAWADETALRIIEAAPIKSSDGTDSTGYITDSTGYIVVGLMLSLIGGAMLGGWMANAETQAGLGVAGWILSVIGAIVLAIGVIAKGVKLGMREHRHQLEPPVWSRPTDRPASTS